MQTKSAAQLLALFRDIRSEGADHADELLIAVEHAYSEALVAEWEAAK